MVQVSFGGSRSTLWQPASFWRRGPGQAAAVRVLGFELPGGEDGGGEGPPPQRMPSQPGTHTAGGPVGAGAALRPHAVVRSPAHSPIAHALSKTCFSVEQMHVVKEADVGSDKGPNAHM